MTAGRLRSLAVAGLVLAIIAACGAIWWFNFGQRWSPKTQLLTDFRVFCVETEAQPGAVSVAIAGASGIEDLPTYDWPHRFGPMTAWMHTAADHEITVAISTVPPGRGEARGENLCQVQDVADNGASLTGLRDWLGNSPPTASWHRKIAWDKYLVTLENGHPHVFARADTKGQDLARKAGKLFTLNVSYSAKSTSLQLIK